MAAAAVVGVERIRNIFHDSSVSEQGRCSVPWSLQIKRIGDAYKASFLAPAIEFLIISTIDDTYVAHIYCILIHCLYGGHAPRRGNRPGPVCDLIMPRTIGG